MGNLGAQKEKRNDTPISAKKDIMGDKTVRVRADLHHIIKFCIIGIEVKCQFLENPKIGHNGQTSLLNNLAFS